MLGGISGSNRVKRRREKNKVQAETRAAVAQNAVAYVRVSTEEQAAHGHGLETQERAARAFAESQGYHLVELVSDAGVSGALRPAERPGFARVLELAERGRFSVLVVHKFDRLARSLGFAVNTVRDLDAIGVTLRSVTESAIDTTTPAGRMMFAVFAAMAENERDTITERTKGGRLTKASKGRHANGPAPYGYELVEGELRIVPEQAAVVRRILKARKRGPKITLQAIADMLNAEAIPAPKGERWHTATVSRIADNPTYRGVTERLFGDTHVLVPGAHEAII